MTQSSKSSGFRRYGKRTLVRVGLVVALLSLGVAFAWAQVPSISLNSPTSFPVDI